MSSLIASAPSGTSLESSLVPAELGEVVEALLSAMEARDVSQRRHCERVARACDSLALAMGVSDDERRALALGALLHDIGNIGIPDSILLKPTGLSPWEFDEMKFHTIIGERICQALSALAPALPLVRSHHEKLDGSGYPDALRGDEISLKVCILSAVDVYDTLRIERSYRDAFTHEQSIDILRQEVERGWWDAQVVEALADLITPDSEFVPA